MLAAACRRAPPIAVKTQIYVDRSSDVSITRLQNGESSAAAWMRAPPLSLPWNGVQLVRIRQFIAVGIATLASSFCGQRLASSQDAPPQPPPDAAASPGGSTVGGLNADMK